MTAREIELHRLLDRRVVDAEGEVIGRLEEMHAEVDPDDPSAYVIREFHLGAYAYLEALAGNAFGRAVARLLWRGAYHRYVVDWRLMDLSDPARPRATVPKRALTDSA